MDEISDIQKDFRLTSIAVRVCDMKKFNDMMKRHMLKMKRKITKPDFFSVIIEKADKGE